MEKNNFRCGMVSIVGRPNTGKSTLLNAIVNEKIAIVSQVPQTTRNQIRAIYNDETTQIIFIDTPGLHISRDRLDQFMNQSSVTMVDDADCVIYLVDPTRQIGEEERAVAERLKSVKAPVIMAFNKMDLKKASIQPFIEFWEELKGKPINEIEDFYMITLSAKNGKNIEHLLELIREVIPEGPALYPTDMISDTPKHMVVSDIIREKFFNCMKKEIPHAIGVIIEEMKPVKGKTMKIKALILVETPSQKEIVIGKKGEVLKNVGTQARVELESILDSKVFLELFVQVKKQWRNDMGLLAQQGYADM